MVQEIDIDSIDLPTLANEHINRAALYEHLAEESVELAQAALKFARYIRGENPTGTDYEKALENLVEEYTDVQLVADVIGLGINGAVYSHKEQRWINRILNKQNLA